MAIHDLDLQTLIVQIQWPQLPLDVKVLSSDFERLLCGCVRLSACPQTSSLLNWFSFTSFRLGRWVAHYDAPILLEDIEIDFLNCIPTLERINLCYLNEVRVLITKKLRTIFYKKRFLQMNKTWMKLIRDRRFIRVEYNHWKKTIHQNTNFFEEDAHHHNKILYRIWDVVTQVNAEMTMKNTL